jgi:hypothetical protein
MLPVQLQAPAARMPEPKEPCLEPLTANRIYLEFTVPAVVAARAALGERRPDPC